MAKSVKMFWWNEVPNFGDVMNPMLIRKLFGLKPEWVLPHQAELLAAGSILQMASPRQNEIGHPLHVWGSGYIHKLSPPLTDRHVSYHAVRGKLSAGYSCQPAGLPLADPGLLAPLLFDKPPAKRYEVGVVPHWSHRGDPALTAFKGAKVINVQGEPLSVIRDIAACEFIFASALHGLIIADAFGIPNRWVHFRAAKHFGGHFKFRDYYSVFGIDDPQPLYMEPTTDLAASRHRSEGDYARPGLARLQDELFKAFPGTLLRR